METLLRAATVRTPRQSVAPPDEAACVRAHAKQTEYGAYLAAIVGVLAIALGMVISNNDAIIIGGSLLGASIWIYLIAQIIHIRANTTK
jgi:uncharacterized membrane protein